LPELRETPRLPAQVFPLPHLLPQAGAAGNDPRGGKGELV